MKYSCRYPSIILGLAATVVMAVACSKMDEYKDKYAPEGEITYTGKIDSVKVASGKNRIQFKALLNADPRVTYYRVYWGGRADSVTFEIGSSVAGGEIQQIVENVPEGEQSFEFVTFDQDGNTSVSTFQNGTSYGSRYQASLSNRRITGSALNADLQTQITLISMAAETGAFSTEVRYLNTDGDSSTCLVPLSTLDTFLVDHQYGTELSYRTLYQPDTSCIDTFYTDYDTYQPVSGATWIDVAANIVSNPGAPFQYAAYDGSRWGTLAEWTQAGDVQNVSSGTYGGFEMRSGVGMLSFEGGWGLPAVNNGKIYQVVHLPYAGKWRFGVTIDTKGSAGSQFIAVNEGTELPDYDNITGATYYLDITSNASGAKPYVEFTVDQETDLCIGLVARMPDSGSYFKVSKVSLSFYKE